MVNNWIRSGVIAVGLGLAGVAAQAATVTDATVDITGNYAFKDGKYRFSGDFTGDLLSNPKTDRLYDIGITISMRGKTVLSQTLAAGKISASPFSVKDVLNGDVVGSGLGRLLGGLDLTSKLSAKSTSSKGEFDAKLAKGRSKLLRLACKSVFSRNSSKKCKQGSEFILTLDFRYNVPGAPLVEHKEVAGPGESVGEFPGESVGEREIPGQPLPEPQPAPVPLPAGLPLLGVGLAALAALRRMQRA